MAKKVIRNNQTDLFYLKGSGFTANSAAEATTFPSYDDAESFIELAKDLGVDDVLIENAPGEKDEEIKAPARRPAAPAPVPYVPLRPAAPAPVAPRAAAAAAPVAAQAARILVGADEAADDGPGAVQNKDGHSWGLSFIRQDGKVSKSKRTFRTRDEARAHAARAVRKYEHKGAQFRRYKRVAVNSWINPETGRTNPPIGKAREGVLG